MRAFVRIAPSAGEVIRGGVAIAAAEVLESVSLKEATLEGRNYRTPAVREEVRRAFAHFDLDGSGNIDRSELRLALAQLGLEGEGEAMEKRRGNGGVRQRQWWCAAEATAVYSRVVQ